MVVQSSGSQLKGDAYHSHLSYVGVLELLKSHLRESLNIFNSMFRLILAFFVRSHRTLLLTLNGSWHKVSSWSNSENSVSALLK